MLKLNSPRSGVRFVALALIVACVFTISVSLTAQTTISTGSIVGTVTDPTGAVVGGARVSIKDTATNQEISVTSNSSG
ncbi:MAG: carboxypeptidase-like regulatory domain-containing protein, partial [Candidatus Sulfotelmatobacter sp.]